MVEPVTDQVQQRLEQVLDDLAVGLYVLAFDDQVERLAELCRGLPHQAREASERMLKRNHSRLGDRSVERGHETIDLMVTVRNSSRPPAAALGSRIIGERYKTILGRDQLAGDLDKLVDARGIHADGCAMAFHGGLGHRTARLAVAGGKGA